MFHNPKRRHGYNGRLSPIEFERQHFMRLESVIQRVKSSFISQTCLNIISYLLRAASAMNGKLRFLHCCNHDEA